MAAEPELYRRVIESVKETVDAKKDPDRAISLMKREGFSPVDCIRGIIELTGWPLPVAHEAMLNSEAWSELRGR